MGCSGFKQQDNEELSLQAVLNVALGNYRYRGFSLQERCDHLLHLYYKDALVAIFNQSVTPVDIQIVCQKHIDSVLMV